MADGPRKHATTPYQQVTEEVIDEVQRAYLAGADLYHVAPWISHENKRVIAAVSLDTDRLLGLSAHRLASEQADYGAMTDFKRAVLAQMLLDAPRSASSAPTTAALEERATAHLADAGRSATASPLLDYERLYRDLAEGALLNDDPTALTWLKRAVAHNLRFYKGDDVVFALIDLASAYLQLDRLDLGLMMLSQLLQNDPSNIWIYRFMATGFAVLGLTSLGLQAARRGLALLDETDDPEELEDELLMARIELQTSPKKGRESVVSPDVLERIESALALDFDSGEHQAPDALCQALVPGWDEVPVKEPLRYEMLPEVVRSYAEARRAESTS